jgi:phosphatidylinositol kinase/protein kinase (PI-3  family)
MLQLMTPQSLPRLDPLRATSNLTYFLPSIPVQAKKTGKKDDMTDFRAQLDSLGLKIIELTADGNCFFRLRVDFCLSNPITLYLCHDKVKGLVDFFKSILLHFMKCASLLSYMTTHCSLQGNG